MSKKYSFVKGVLILGFFLGLQLSTRAAIYVCKTSADGTNVHTLRGAIIAAASSRSKNDTIILTRDSYQVTAQVYDDELTVTGGNLTIVGREHSRVMINAASLLHVFHVLPGAQLTLKNLTITGGGDYHYYGYNGTLGGAVFNEGTLRLVNCCVQGNGAANGAGIYNSGDLTMNNSVVANNSCSSGSGGNGGGIYNAGVLSANFCAISNNSSGAGIDAVFFISGINILNTNLPSYPGGDAGNGGGIYNDGAMLLNNCEIMNNVTSNGGDASESLNQGSDGGTGGNGGGIYNAGDLTLKHCIIGGNSCGKGGSGADVLGAPYAIGGNGGNGGTAGSGGGIFNADGFSVNSYNSFDCFE